MNNRDWGFLLVGATILTLLSSIGFLFGIFQYNSAIIENTNSFIISNFIVGIIVLIYGAYLIKKNK